MTHCDGHSYCAKYQQCFKTGDELIVAYAMMPAFG